MSRSAVVGSSSLEVLLDPVTVLRIFYLAASLLVSRHRSACFITD